MSLVIVTGVARPGQVGETVARQLAAAGHHVVLLHRDGAAAEQRAAELRADALHATAIGVDLTDAPALDRVAATVRALEDDGASGAGGVAALVNVAGGFAMSGPLDQSDPAELQRLLAINLTTAYLATRAFLPALRRARGAVVYFGSAAALPEGKPAGMAAYAAAKSAVHTLMRAVAAAEAPHGVRANALAPTSIRTATNVAAMGADAPYVERESVAAVVAWLCSDAARDVTGQLLRLGR